MNLMFCNHAHHGDLFIVRGMVTDLVKQLSHLHLYYAHFCNHKVMNDIMPSLDTALARSIWNDHHFEKFVRVDINGGTIPVLNTWVGAYHGHWPGGHPSYVYLYKIFENCYNILNSELEVNVKLNPNIWHYIPDINYDHYDLTIANQFLTNHEKIYLFCNGHVHSMQSQMDNMKSIIEILAERHKDATFLVTEKFNTVLPNIKFTSDLFQYDNDLCEISYISTKVNLIVGKNSGPFTYTNTKRNLLDTKKIFVNFSNHGVDTLPYDLGISADFRHTSTTYLYYALEILEQAIEDARTNNQISGFKYV